MKNLILFFLLIVSVQVEAQNIKYSVVEGEDGFEFSRVEVDALGNEKNGEKSIGLDSAMLLEIINIQMDMATDIETAANLKLADARRSKKDLIEFRDAFFTQTYDETIVEKENKYDGFWRLRYQKEKFEVEIIKGKIKSSGANNGIVKLISEKSLEVKSFNRWEDFKLFDNGQGVLVGDIEGEKIVLKYLGKESKETEDANKKK